MGPADLIASVRGRAEIVAYRGGWGAVRRMPAGAAYAAFERIADVQARRGGKGIDRMRANYARVRPELDDAALDLLVRDGMRSYLRYFCDAFRLPDRSPEELAAAVRAENDGAVRADLAAGTSAVIFLAHLGNWDAAGAWSAGHLAPVTSVAERLRPEAIFQEFLAFRERLGMTILPLTGGSNPFVGLRAAVGRGDFVALVADRDLTSNGVEVEFFGRRARMAKGPALLSLVTGAPLYAASITYEHAAPERGAAGYRTVVRFSDRIRPSCAPAPDLTPEEQAAQVRALTQACAAYLEEPIREHTADWHMMQRVFVEDLDPARTAAATSSAPAP